MKPKTKELLKTLEALRWFSAVGKPLAEELEGIVVVSKWMDALSYLLDGFWEITGYEQGIALEKALKAASKRKEWKQAHAELEPLDRNLVKAKLDEFRKQRELSRMVDMIVSYDIHYALLETEFADVVKPGFFSWKLEWYLQGRFPCGMTEQGNSVIF